MGGRTQRPANRAPLARRRLGGSERHGADPIQGPPPLKESPSATLNLRRRRAVTRYSLLCAHRAHRPALGAGRWERCWLLARQGAAPAAAALRTECATPGTNKPQGVRLGAALRLKLRAPSAAAIVSCGGLQNCIAGRIAALAFRVSSSSLLAGACSASLLALLAGSSDSYSDDRGGTGGLASQDLSSRLLQGRASPYVALGHLQGCRAAMRNAPTAGSWARTPPARPPPLAARYINVSPRHASTPRSACPLSLSPTRCTSPRLARWQFPACHSPAAPHGRTLSEL